MDKHDVLTVLMVAFVFTVLAFGAAAAGFVTPLGA